MPLFSLLEVPTTVSHWENYTFNTREQIDKIHQAILTQKGVNLTQYVLYPVNFGDPQNIQQWLTNNQQSHDDFNSILDLQSSDIEDVDIKDLNQLQSWVNLVYQELYTACSILKI